MTSALRGTKTGRRNYISACVACQRATFRSLGPQNDVKIILCSIAAWRDYHSPVVHYDNTDVYTCLREVARFTLSSLANVQYAYELVGRDLN